MDFKASFVFGDLSEVGYLDKPLGQQLALK